MIDNPGKQVNHARKRRAQDRGRQAGRVAVEREQDDRRRIRRPDRQPRDSTQQDEQRGEERDVTAGDGDDVVRARLLEASLIVLIEAASIADQNRRHDASRPRVPSANGIRRCGANVRAH